MQRAHRIGAARDRPTVDKFPPMVENFQPIVDNFQPWKEKDDIVRIGFKLLSSAVREKRRALRSWSAARREDKNNKMRLSYGKIWIKGDLYTWDIDSRKATVLRSGNNPVREE